MDVLFIHGYSETSLGAYYTLPARLQAAVPAVTRVAIAAYDSLDDTVTISDLADAMETRMTAMEVRGAPPWDTARCAIICHSTGALVARRWILNRLARGKPIPSHLVTLAGANHGSTLAQLGKTPLGYLQKLLSKHILTVGAQVLTDLDYGSDFLWRLNTEWMDRSNDGSLDNLWLFCMGGDSIGSDPAMQLFWATHEHGSDNTVRISGANLNYTIIDAAHDDNHQPVVIAKTLKRRVPHLVLDGYSHFGDVSGINGWVDPSGDRVTAALAQALGVTDAAGYAGVLSAWDRATTSWMGKKRATNPGPGTADINATVVFDMRDESGRPIDDCLIAIMDASKLTDPSHASASTVQAAADALDASNSVSAAIIAHSPIHNDVAVGSYSFYIDYDTYVTTSPHFFHAEAAVPSQWIGFVPLTFTQPPTLTHAIAPNEVTYLRLTMSRAVEQAYAAYSVPFDPATTWSPMPFPTPGQVP